MIALCTLNQQRSRAGRTDLFIRVDENLPSHDIGKVRSLQSFERDQHHNDPAFRIGHARPTECAGTHPLCGLKRLIKAVDRVHVNAKKDAKRSIRAFDDRQGAAQWSLGELAGRVDDLAWHQIDQLHLATQRAERIAKFRGHVRQPIDVVRGGVDVRPTFDELEHAHSL